MTRILVTGATGMLGRTLVPILRGAGHEVIEHGLCASAQAAGDLSNRDVAQAILDEWVPEVVINLAALTNVDQCEEHPAEAQRLNVGIVENLAGWIAPRPGAWLVQISTDQVYDGPGPHAEAGVALSNVYAKSKYAGELAAQRAPAVVLRTNFFGPSQLPGRASFSDWIIAKLRSGEPLTLFDDVYFSPLSMDTLSQLLARVVSGPQKGVFNLGAATGLSKAAFAMRIAAHLKADTSEVTLGSVAGSGLKAYRPSDMRMTSGLFESTFGIRLPSLESDIARALDGDVAQGKIKA